MKKNIIWIVICIIVAISGFGIGKYVGNDIKESDLELVSDYNYYKGKEEGFNEGQNDILNAIFRNGYGKKDLTIDGKCEFTYELYSWDLCEKEEP